MKNIIIEIKYKVSGQNSRLVINEEVISELEGSPKKLQNKAQKHRDGENQREFENEKVQPIFH